MKEELKQRKNAEGRARALMYLRECMDDKGTLNITKFRNLHRPEYSKLSTYFGSVDDAMAAVGAIKVTSQKTTPTLVQQLAYAYLQKESKIKHVAEIAREFNVSRAGMNQLFKRLEKLIDG